MYIHLRNFSYNKINMKLIQLISYRVYGCAYADHAREMGVEAEPFYIEDRPRAKFPSKADVVWGYIYGFFKMTLHFHTFRNVKILSTGGYSCYAIFAPLQRRARS